MQYRYACCTDTHAVQIRMLYRYACDDAVQIRSYYGAPFVSKLSRATIRFRGHDSFSRRRFSFRGDESAATNFVADDSFSGR